MYEKDTIKQIKGLKDIKPNADWAVSVRQELVNHIENTTPQPQRGIFFEWNITNTRMAGAIALVVLVFTITTASLSQGSLSAPFKVLSGNFENFVENSTLEEGLLLQTILVERRVEQATELAVKLNASDQEFVIEKLTAYKQDINVAKDERNEEKTREILEEARFFTVVVSNSSNSFTFMQDLRLATQDRLAQCSDEAAQTEIQELLDEGDVVSLIAAIEYKCSE